MSAESRQEEVPEIGFNGAGRITRSTIRHLAEDPNQLKQVTAINDPNLDPEQFAYLFRADSVHGLFDGEVRKTDGGVVINGHPIELTNHRNIDELDWKGATVVEASGVFTDGNKARDHIDKAYAKRVLISAPGTNVDGTFTLGVNSDNFDPDTHKVLSLASCTTGAVTPIIKAIDEAFGAERILFTTVHAYTGDQSLVDGGHRKELSRGKAAGVNFVPAATGASKAIGAVLPHLKDIPMDGIAIRGPVADGSLIDITIDVRNGPESIAKINDALRNASQSTLKGILELSDWAKVSSDVIGNNHSSVVFEGNTSMIGKEPRAAVRLLGGYDNEGAYAKRVAEAALGSNKPGFGRPQEEYSVDLNRPQPLPGQRDRAR